MKQGGEQSKAEKSTLLLGTGLTLPGPVKCSWWFLFVCSAGTWVQGLSQMSALAPSYIANPEMCIFNKFSRDGNCLRY